MNDGFRQRLVGAVVLACLALIIWPIIFSDANKPIVDRTTQIPPTPQFKEFNITKPVKPANVESVSVVEIDELDVVSAQETQPTVNTENVSPVNDRPALDKKGIPVSWVLQVASFSDMSNANEVKKSLQDKGYKAYTRSFNSKERQVTRVFIGPKLTKTALLKDKPSIDKMFNVNSMVIRFQP